MQSLRSQIHRSVRCDKLQRIETRYDTTAISPEDDDASLAGLLRRAVRVRADDDFEFRRLVHEILQLESYVIRQKVIAHGTRQTGNRWVDPDVVDDVTNRVLERVARFIGEMQGSAVGQLRAGISKAVHWEVVDHVRRDQRNESSPVDPANFTGTLDAQDTGYRRLSELAASNRAEDLVMFRERLAELTGLGERDATVVLMRKLQGLSSKEVAEELGLTPANVDQIVSRGMKRLAECEA